MIELLTKEEKKVEFSERLIKYENKEFKLEAFISYHNKRIRLVDYSGPELKYVLEKLDHLADENKFATKIFAKIKERDSKLFLNHGYIEEGVINNYFGKEDGIVCSKFLTEKTNFY